jgi:hypothetical protein
MLLPGLVLDHGPPIFAFQVARITGVDHHTQHNSYFEECHDSNTWSHQDQFLLTTFAIETGTVSCFFVHFMILGVNTCWCCSLVT